MPFTSPRTSRRRFIPLNQVSASQDNSTGTPACCAAAIAASALSLFFDQGHLNAVKVVYPAAYHAAIRSWVERQVKQASGDSPPGPVVSGGVAAWRVGDGVLVLKDGDLGPSDEPALLWLSGAAVAARADLGGP